MNKILVTGGTGYIGSHTAVVLLQAGYEVVIVDNLCNSHAKVIDNIEQITSKRPTFYKVDVTDSARMEAVFEKHNFAAVIHFAGYKAVGVSVEQPLKYYKNNLNATLVVAKMCHKFKVNKIVFSSSATVYGDNVSPMSETMDLLPTTNPYAETKAMGERILTDFVNSSPGMSVVLLRYFNPVGSHESGLIGELPQGIPNNLMPYVWQVAIGWRESLNIFGDDYPTIDGTGVRDYIHVCDLADGHLAALQKLGVGLHTYNLGTGQGVSVLQIVKTFEKAVGVKVPYKIEPRRAGDIAICYADSSKAMQDLHWKAKRTMEQICIDTWRFASTQPSL